jgi:hypothetical protein
MAFPSLVLYADTVNYCNSTGYAAVPAWAAGTAYKSGQVVRQAAVPALNNERCFVCPADGSSGGTEPAWVLTRGAKTVDGSISWIECTGGSAVNGDFTNTPTWAFAADNLAGRKIASGQIIRFVNTSTGEASYHVCTTAGVAGGSQPSFNKTAGSVVTDGTVVWTSLGLVANAVKGGAPHARIANAGVDGWFYGQGNTIFVGDNHAEVQSTADLTFITNWQTMDQILINKMLCHDHASSYPPTETDLKAGAVVQTTGTYRFSFSPGGSFYVYGVTFKSSSYIFISPVAGLGSIFGAGIQKQNWASFDKCSFWLTSATGSGNLYMGQSYVFGGRIFACIIFNNTTINFANPNLYISPYNVRFIWRNTVPILEPGSKVPANFIVTAGIDDCFYDVLFEACDLSQHDQKIYFSDFWQQASMVLKDCKLHPEVTFDDVPEDVGMIVQLARCDHAAATWRTDLLVTEGRDTTDVIIVRNGGAIDPADQHQSRRLATTNGAAWVRPFKASPYAIWNSIVGSPITLSISGLANVAPPVMNDDIWIEVMYLADPTSTLGTIVKTTKANFLSPSAVVTPDDSRWTNINKAVFDGSSLQNVVLLNGNRTVKYDVKSWQLPIGGARVLSYQSNGKLYFEVRLDTDACGAVGMALPTCDPYEFAVSRFDSMSVDLPTGRIYSNNVTTGKVLGAFVKGDYACIFADLDSNRVWARRNGGLWNATAGANPDSNSGGLPLAAGYYTPAVGFYAPGNLKAGDAFTLNSGWEGYAQIPPTSAVDWPADTVNWVPFKLSVTITPALAGYIHVRPMMARPSATFFLDPLIVSS